MAKEKPFFVRPLPFTIQSESSELAAKPADHLAEIDTPGMVWSSDSETAPYVVIDLGAAVDYDFISVISSNASRFTSMRIRGANSTGALTSGADYDTLSFTQRLKYTDDLAGAAWTLGQATLETDSYTAPDGTVTADKLVEDSTASSYHRVHNTLDTMDLASNYVASVFAKSAGRQWLRMQITNEDGDTYVRWFDLANGALGSESGVSHTAAIEDWGDGWYRCSVLFNSGAVDDSTARLWLNIATQDAETNYDGDGSSGILLWRANLTKGTELRSALPATASATTGGREMFRQPDIIREDGLYHSFHELPATQTDRYIRLDFYGFNDDFEAATIVVGQKIESETFYSPGWEFEPVDLGKLDISRHGVIEDADGLVYRRAAFTLAWMTYSEYETAFQPMLEAIGHRGLIYCCFDPEDAAKRQANCFLGWMKKAPVARGGKRFGKYEVDFDMLSMI